MANLSDVAARAGVSIRTVRRVLYEPGLVGARTAARVRAVLEELDYAPNPLARALGGGKSNAVALVVPPLVGFWYVGSILIVALEHALASLGLQAVFFVSDRESAAQTVKEIQQQVPQAVLLVQAAWDEAYRGLMGDGTVVVGIDVRLQVSDDVPADFIGLDRVGAFRSATEHLLALGHRRIGLLNQCGAKGRVEGFSQAMTAAGLDPGPTVLADAEGVLGPPIRPALEQLLAQHPDLTGLVCTTDLYTQQVLRHLADMGRRVPEDISLTSYSNEPWTQWAIPALTTLDQRTDLLCTYAMETMQRRLQGDEDPWERRIIRPALIVRESTAPPRGA